MATPFYEKSTGVVVIEWYETKETSSSPIRHHFEAKPLKLQLHPKDPTQVIRIYFRGRMPSWMSRYVKEKEHPFECKEVFQDGMVGWWIANWRNHDSGRPFNAPSIKGCINAFIDRIPWMLEDYRERLREGADTIASNLAVDPAFYEPFGLYYRSEEVSNDGGAMVVSEELFPDQMSEESDLDFESRIRSQGGLDRLIFELTTPIPVSSFDDDEVSASNEDQEFELTFEEEEIEFSLVFEDGDMESKKEDDSLSGLSLVFEDEETGSSAPEVDNIGLQSGEPEGHVETGTDDEANNSKERLQASDSAPAEPVLDGDGPVKTQSEEELVINNVETNQEGVVVVSPAAAPDPAPAPTEPEDSLDQEENDLLQLQVIGNSNRKHNAFAGQLSFF